MLNNFLHPKHMVSPSGKTELVEARAFDTLGIVMAAKSMLAGAMGPQERDRVRRESGLYIRPTLGFESFDAIVPVMFAASPAIRLSRKWGGPGLFDRVDLFAIKDTATKSVIGFSTIEQQADNLSEVEATCYLVPQARHKGHFKEALPMALRRAEEIFGATDLKLVSSQLEKAGAIEKLGLHFDRSDMAPDKRGLRNIFRGKIATVLGHLA